MMQHFDSDYMEGAHPQILKKLIETNMEKTPGYGTDRYCQSAMRPGQLKLAAIRY